MDICASEPHLPRRQLHPVVLPWDTRRHRIVVDGVHKGRGYLWSGEEGHEESGNEGAWEVARDLIPRGGEAHRMDSASMSYGQRNTTLALVLMFISVLESSPPGNRVCSRW